MIRQKQKQGREIRRAGLHFALRRINLIRDLKGFLDVRSVNFQGKSIPSRGLHKCQSPQGSEAGLQRSSQGPVRRDGQS